jgi:hypothetical protein
MIYTAEELNQIIHFLNKCTIFGNESIVHAQLIIKTQKLIQGAQEPQDAPKPLTKVK